MVKYKLLYLENDRNLTQVLSSAFDLDGLSLKAVGSGGALVESLRQTRWDALVLDMNTPGTDGYDLCEEARTLYPTMPILMVSEATDEASAVRGLLSGANDYIRKPIGPREAVLKIKRALGQFDELRFGKLLVDATRRSVEYDGKAMDLRRREFDLLLILLKQIGKVVKREEIFQALQTGERASLQLIDCHLSRLRKKFRDSGASEFEVKSVYGIGYSIRIKNTPSKE